MKDGDNENDLRDAVYAFFLSNDDREKGEGEDTYETIHALLCRHKLSARRSVLRHLYTSFVVDLVRERIYVSLGYTASFPLEHREKYRALCQRLENDGVLISRVRFW